MTREPLTSLSHSLTLVCALFLFLFPSFILSLAHTFSFHGIALPLFLSLCSVRHMIQWWQTMYGWRVCCFLWMKCVVYTDWTIFVCEYVCYYVFMCMFIYIYLCECVTMYVHAQPQLLPSLFSSLLIHSVNNSPLLTFDTFASTHTHTLSNSHTDRVHILISKFVVCLFIGSMCVIMQHPVSSGGLCNNALCSQWRVSVCDS